MCFFFSHCTLPINEHQTEVHHRKYTLQCSAVYQPISMYTTINALKHCTVYNTLVHNTLYQYIDIGTSTMTVHRRKCALQSISKAMRWRWKAFRLGCKLMDVKRVSERLSIDLHKLLFHLPLICFICSCTGGDRGGECCKKGLI